MKPLHDIQLHILNKLLFSTSLRYSDLQPDSPLPSNQLVFHIEKLIDVGYVEKNELEYSLSTKGKEYANRLDTEKVKMTRQAKRGVMLIATREGSKGNSDAELEYLIFTRRKQPFYGKQGFPTGKVPRAERVRDTADRELLEETNLQGKCELFLIEHSIVRDEENTILHDKFLYTYVVSEVTGDMQCNTEGELERVLESQLRKKITNSFYGIDNFMSFIDKIKKFRKDGQINFVEVEKRVTKEEF